MKYLNSFKIFESISYKDKEELLKGCKDILLQLEDNDFNCRIQYLYTDWIKFYINKNSVNKEPSFYWSDVEDVVEQLKDYLIDFDLVFNGMSGISVSTIHRGVRDPRTFQLTGLYRTGLEIKFSELKQNRIRENLNEKHSYSDRDKTNMYLKSNNWVEYSYNYDFYDEIEKNFDIDYDHIGYILEELVETCDLEYSCKIVDYSGIPMDADDYKGPEFILVEFKPREIHVHQPQCDIYTCMAVYMSKYDDVLPTLLENIEKRLNEFNLTIPQNITHHITKIRLYIARK